MSESSIHVGKCLGVLKLSLHSLLLETLLIGKSGSPPTPPNTSPQTATTGVPAKPSTAPSSRSIPPPPPLWAGFPIDFDPHCFSSLPSRGLLFLGPQPFLKYWCLRCLYWFLPSLCTHVGLPAPSPSGASGTTQSSSRPNYPGAGPSLPGYAVGTLDSNASPMRLITFPSCPLLVPSFGCTLCLLLPQPVRSGEETGLEEDRGSA